MGLSFISAGLSTSAISTPYYQHYLLSVLFATNTLQLILLATSTIVCYQYPNLLPIYYFATSITLLPVLLATGTTLLPVLLCHQWVGQVPFPLYLSLSTGTYQ